MPQDYRNREFIRSWNPRVAEAFDDIMASLGRVGLQTVASIVGSTPAPPAPSALIVTAANGIFDAAISDNNPVFRGINYFLEYSASSNFATPIVVDLGASRNWRGTLGSLTLFFRAYSQYVTSPPSAWVYFGSASVPTAVVGGGSAGPAINASKGSGTARGDGTQGGSGFGRTLSRPTVRTD